MKFGTTVLSVSASIVLALGSSPVSAANVTPGAKCQKLGSVGKYRGMFVNCEKSGKKLQWRLAPTQGLITGSLNCGSSVNLYAIANSGAITSQRELVAGSGQLLLRPLDFDSRSPGNLLFSTYDCQTKSQLLFQTTVSGSSEPDLLLKIEPGTTLLGAKYDPARDTAIALIADAKRNYTVQIRTGLTWTPIWTATPATLGGTYLNGIFANTGSEFILYGMRSGRWLMIRVGPDFYTSARQTGPGDLLDIGETTLGEIRGITSSQGVWACSGANTDTIEASVMAQRCLQISSSGANFPAFLYASSSADSYWFYYQDSGLLTSIQRTKVYCAQKDFFSCGSLRAEVPSKATGIYGYGLISASFFDVNFNKIGSRRLPVLP